MFEVLGLDQARRLADVGIPEERIPPQTRPVTGRVLAADFVRCRCLMACATDPVSSFTPAIGGSPTTRTPSSKPTRNISGNRRHGLRFWLNAVGAKADRVESELRGRGIFVYRSSPVPLEQLPRLLLAADVHLITLRDAFVGYVLPSKVHACIESGKRIIFVGSESSDVHFLASRALSPLDYRRVDVGDVDGLVKVLHEMESAVVDERKLRMEAAS